MATNSGVAAKLQQSLLKEGERLERLLEELGPLLETQFQNLQEWTNAYVAMCKELPVAINGAYDTKKFGLIAHLVLEWWKNYNQVQDAFTSLINGSIRHRYDVSGDTIPCAHLKEHTSKGVKRRGDCLDNFKHILKQVRKGVVKLAAKAICDKVEVGVESLRSLVKESTAELRLRCTGLKIVGSERGQLKYTQNGTILVQLQPHSCSGFEECKCGGAQPRNPSVEQWLRDAPEAVKTMGPSRKKPRIEHSSKSEEALAPSEGLKVNEFQRSAEELEMEIDAAAMASEEGCAAVEAMLDNVFTQFDRAMDQGALDAAELLLDDARTKVAEIRAREDHACNHLVVVAEEKVSRLLGDVYMAKVEASYEDEAVRLGGLQKAARHYKDSLSKCRSDTPTYLIALYNCGRVRLHLQMFGKASYYLSTCLEEFNRMQPSLNKTENETCCMIAGCAWLYRAECEEGTHGVVGINDTIDFLNIALQHLELSGDDHTQRERFEALLRVFSAHAQRPKRIKLRPWMTALKETAKLLDTEGVGSVELVESWKERIKQALVFIEKQEEVASLPRHLSVGTGPFFSRRIPSSGLMDKSLKQWRLQPPLKLEGCAAKQVSQDSSAKEQGSTSSATPPEFTTFRQQQAQTYAQGHSGEGDQEHAPTTALCSAYLAACGAGMATPNPRLVAQLNKYSEYSTLALDGCCLSDEDMNHCVIAVVNCEAQKEVEAAQTSSPSHVTRIHASRNLRITSIQMLAPLFPNLVELCLSRCRLTSDSLKHFAAAPLLTKLSLADNPITYHQSGRGTSLPEVFDAFGKFLERCASLVYLDISGCSCSLLPNAMSETGGLLLMGAVRRWIVSVPCIQVLSIGHNSLTGEAWADLLDTLVASPIQKLDLTSSVVIDSNDRYRSPSLWPLLRGGLAEIVAPSAKGFLPPPPASVGEQVLADLRPHTSSSPSPLRRLELSHLVSRDVLHLSSQIKQLTCLKSLSLSHCVFGSEGQSVVSSLITALPQGMLSLSLTSCGLSLPAVTSLLTVLKDRLSSSSLRSLCLQGNPLREYEGTAQLRETEENEFVDAVVALRCALLTQALAGGGTRVDAGGKALGFLLDLQNCKLVKGDDFVKKLEAAASGVIALKL